MSVKSSVTVPCGSSRTGRMMTTPGAAPNQRARRVEANASFSAASSSDGPTTVATGDGPPRKLAWIFATRPLPNSMKQLPSPS